MTSFLPALEDTLVDLLHYGDTGALRVTLEERRWTFYVQGGILIGVEREPPVAEAAPDATEHAARLLVEAMQAKGALWDFEEGGAPDDFGLYDVRRALADAMGRARDAPELIRMLQEVLDGWPELKVDADTLSGDPQVQAWLQTLDGLSPGSQRLTQAPARPGPALGALWVAWKLGDLDLHIGSIEDEEPSDVIDIHGQDPVVDDPHVPAEVAALDEHDPHEETAEVEEETAQTLHTHPSNADTRRRLLEELAGRNRTAREDPFIVGVAKARAGEAQEALPLLEASWEEDPDRPGLEEWLGYTRFAACRDSDPDKARHGLAMVRDAMYRTTPSGETPILPWILMARAQLERGDLVQARSQVNAVLEREPDDPEAMFLEAELRKAEAEADKLKDREEGISLARIARMTGGVALVAVLVLAVQVQETNTEPRSNYAAQAPESIPLRELHRVARGWVGVTAAEWAPPQGEVALRDACEQVAEAVYMNPDETLLLLSDPGVPLTECGERLSPLPVAQQGELGRAPPAAASTDRPEQQPEDEAADSGAATEPDQ